jgi:hypothetical protein
VRHDSAVALAVRWEELPSLNESVNEAPRCNHTEGYSLEELSQWEV